jgi:transcriptional regulator with XRE-family HTH domain
MEIKVAMVRAGVSGRQLALRLGVSQTWISTRLNGVTPLDLNDVQKIADALGVPVLELFPSRVAGRPSGGATQTIVSANLPHPAATPRPNVPRPNGRTVTNPVVASASPLGGGRRDSTRPVSGVPASRRRPAPTGPGNRPISA